MIFKVCNTNLNFLQFTDYYQVKSIISEEGEVKN